MNDITREVDALVKKMDTVKNSMTIFLLNILKKWEICRSDSRRSSGQESYRMMSTKPAMTS